MKTAASPPEADPETLLDVLRFHQRTKSSIDALGRRSGFVDLSMDALRGLEFAENRLSVDSRIDSDAFPPEPSLMPRAASCRRFARRKLPYLKVRRLLQHSFGAKQTGGTPRRPYPSAGALYPVQVLLLVIGDRISGRRDLAGGVYHFLPVSSKLERIADADKADVLGAAGANLLENLPHFGIAYAVDFDKALVKYRHRGYRHALIEVGLMAQQASLVGDRLSLGSTIWSSFSDFRMDRLCALHPAKISVVCVQWFGLRAEATTR